MSHPFRHFVTITRHRHAVIQHCFRAGIGFQGLFHDLSKYGPTEFILGARFYTGTRSPHVGERERYGYSRAWMHHKGRNRHHFEYWVDLDPVLRVYCPVRMPVKYVAEMFCDRVAASKIYQGKDYSDHHPIEYFRRGKITKDMHPETAALLESWLVALDEEGEDAAFDKIRACLKAERKQKKEEKKKRKKEQKEEREKEREKVRKKD